MTAIRTYTLHLVTVGAILNAVIRADFPTVLIALFAIGVCLAVGK